MDPQSEDQDQIGFGPHPGQQPLPVDFTTADSLRLQQLNAGLSTVSQQLADGELEPHHANDLQQQIMAQKLPLMQRQKAAADGARQTSIQQLQQDSAQAQGMAHSDQVFRAKGLVDRVVPIMHPQTGQTAFLYEQEPGKFGQVAFDNPMEAPNDVPGGVTGYGGGEQAGPTQSEGSPASAERPTESPDSVGGPATPPPPPAPRVADVGHDGHTLEIMNGPERELVHFDRSGQIVGRHAFDAQGNEVQPQGPPPANEDVLTPHEMDFIRSQAEQSVPAVQHPTGPMNPLAQMHYDQAVNARNMQVARTAQGMANRMLQQRAAKQHQQWRAGENEVQNQRMVARQETTKTKAADDKKAGETFQKRLEKHVDHLTTEDAKNGVKRSHAERVNEAKDRMEAEGYEDPARKAQTEEATKAAAPIIERAQAAGDADGVAAAHTLATIAAKYGKIDKAPAEVQQQARALLGRVQKYMGGEVKPVGPPPPRTIEETLPKATPTRRQMPGGAPSYGTGGGMG